MFHEFHKAYKWILVGKVNGWFAEHVHSEDDYDLLQLFEVECLHVPQLYLTRSAQGCFVSFFDVFLDAHIYFFFFEE